MKKMMKYEIKLIDIEKIRKNLNFKNNYIIKELNNKCNEYLKIKRKAYGNILII